ncbi:hypothetical protein V9T40_009962 [Parthenolecanium corni]|uniref:Uncharacterized protein n=1 Tax=Parthenolecanium corni TaxID=536013 RepID=A0AAN9TNM1_9HEMI
MDVTLSTPTTELNVRRVLQKKLMKRLQSLASRKDLHWSWREATYGSVCGDSFVSGYEIHALLPGSSTFAQHKARTPSTTRGGRSGGSALLLVQRVVPRTFPETSEESTFLLSGCILTLFLKYLGIDVQFSSRCLIFSPDVLIFVQMVHFSSGCLIFSQDVSFFLKMSQFSPRRHLDENWDNWTKNETSRRKLGKLDEN